MFPKRRSTEKQEEEECFAEKREVGREKTEVPTPVSPRSSYTTIFER
jgi:hypothetical protein